MHLNLTSKSVNVWLLRYSIWISRPFSLLSSFHRCWLWLRRRQQTYLQQLLPAYRHFLWWKCYSMYTFFVNYNLTCLILQNHLKFPVCFSLGYVTKIILVKHTYRWSRIKTGYLHFSNCSGESKNFRISLFFILFFLFHNIILD